MKTTQLAADSSARRCSAEFWMVLNPEGYAPRVEHLTELSAREEAERLARANVGKRFIVLKSVATCRVRPRPDVEWNDGWENASTPF